MSTAFLVVADEGYGRQVPFAFLEKVREEFQQKFADKGRTSPAHSLDKQFGQVFQFFTLAALCVAADVPEI